MRDQYAGDISDVLKFGLLRALAANDRKLGVAWYYAPGHDGRPDGRHLEWLNDEAWKKLDHEVVNSLSCLPERSIEALEHAALWPGGSLFHRDPMPPSSGRQRWAERKREALDECNLVFLDPDNGLGTDPEKHATFAEVRDLRRPGRAIVLITFPKRVQHDLQVRELHENLKKETGAEAIFTVRTSVSIPSVKKPTFFVPRIRWFTVVDSDAALLQRAQSFALALSLIPRATAKID